MEYLFLFGIPAIVIICTAIIFKKTISKKEMAIQLVLALVVAVASMSLSYHSQIADHEIWSGYVTGKERNEVSCEHSYKCNCYDSCSTDSKGNRSCVEVCQTCYEHNYDVDWDVYSTVGSYTINRVDRQGLSKPSRWAEVKNDDPVMRKKHYKNYIKGAKNSLYNKKDIDLGRYKKYVPKYPSNIHDYYKLNKTILVNKFTMMERQSFNNELVKINSRIGAKKQVNMIVIFVRELSQDFIYAIEKDWIGGKKNDAILVIGSNDNKTIAWTRVLALTKSTRFQVELEQAINAYGKIDKGLLPIFKDNVVKNFERKPMKDFEYLKSSIKPTSKQLTISLIICLLLSIIGSVIMHKQEI